MTDYGLHMLRRHMRPLARALTAGFHITADQILPPTCARCARLIAAGAGLCHHCWADLDQLEPPWCHRLGLPFSYDLGPEAISPQAIADPPNFHRARAATAYKGAARELVHQFKFSDRPDLAPFMARMMMRAGAEILSADSLLIPVPLHWSRLWWRRYNQAALLANALSEECGLPALFHALTRCRRTRRQIGLGRQARQDNVKHAFVVGPAHRRDVDGRHIVLIDDVITSGATARACSAVLLNSRAATVDVLAFAQAGAEPLAA